MHHRKATCRHRRHHAFLQYAVLLGIVWTFSTVSCVEYRRVSRKLSSPEPDLDGKFSHEDLRNLLSLLEGKHRGNEQTTTTTERAPQSEHKVIPPELIRVHSSTPSTTTTTSPPPSRITTRRFYRRLRRKTSTTPPPSTTSSTESHLTPSTSTGRALSSDGESARALPTGSSPSDLFQQLSLLNGILGALNSSASPAPAPTAFVAPSSAETKNNNENNDGTGNTVPDILAILTGAKNMVGDASSKSEAIVAPPSPSPPSTSQSSPTTLGQQVDDPAAALAILNLLGNGNANSNNNNQAKDSSSESAAALLNLMSQSQPQPSAQPASSSLSDSDTTAALTKLLLQSAAPSPGNGNPLQGNSLLQTPQQTQSNAEQSANQLTSLLGLLGTLGAAAGQQPQSNNINNLFNLGGDQVAQAQTQNHLATLFGAQQQPQNQAQNLLSLLGGNQGNQGFSLSNLLGGQSGNQNAIPGLGLLSTVSSLGTSLLGTVSNIFGGGRDGKSRVRGKGVDTRVGLGYRLGNIGDAQVVWDIGPQLFTEPLRNEVRPYTKKRESGPPAASSSHYFQPSSTTATEKEVQQIEAKRRMVQAAIQDHYRGDHFASVYPKQTKRKTSGYDAGSHYYSHHPTNQYDSYKSSYSPSTSKSKSSSASSSSFFSFIPFADHFKGFWSGLTSGLSGEEGQPDSASASNYFNFDDIRSDFSANLIKRSSPDYTEYESRAYHPRRLDDDKIDDPTHSTLTEYERMLLQYGKDIGVANTKHGVIEEEHEEPEQSESSNIFSRWFKNPLSSLSTSLTSGIPHRNQASDWDSMSGASNEYISRAPAPLQKSVKKTFRQPSTSSSSSLPYGHDGSFNRRNEANSHPRRAPNHRPQKRKSHNPFRNFIASLKTSAGFGGGHRSRPQQQTGGFGRRHFKKPSVSSNPKLQHFTNTNKDLMMADTMTDDFVQSVGREAVPGYSEGYEQPLSYKYADEFPDVSLTNTDTPRRRVRPTSISGLSSSTRTNSQIRATLTQREKIIEPALLYDHLEIEEQSNPESDESFHSRNKVVVNPKLRDIEKQKVLGTASPIISSTPLTKSKTVVTPSLATLQKIQRLRLKQRANLHNMTNSGKSKKKIIVKIKGNSNNNKKVVMGNNDETVSESTTALPSVLSTISSIFSGTSKPKLRLGNLIHNASSLLPSISSIRILPRKKKKDDKTRLTLMNGKPTIVGPPDDEEDDLDAEGSETEPVVQIGHDMDFAELQKIFGASKTNNTKKRRFRIRVKESILKGETATSDKEKDDKERKDSDEAEDGDDDMKDIFVDIESGEVSVLKPVASLVSFAPKKEEKSEEEDVDYYEDDDGDGVADMDMKRKEHIFDAIQKQLVKSFEKMKKAQQKAEEKKRRKQELAEKGMDESMDVVTKYFDLLKSNSNHEEEKAIKIKSPGGLEKK